MNLPAWSRWDAARSWGEALRVAGERRAECLAAGRGYAAKQYIWRSYVHEQFSGDQFWIISGMPRSVGA